MTPVDKEALEGVALAVVIALALIVLGLLSGCESLQRKPVAVEIRTVETVKMVPIPCIDPADVPARTATVMPDPEADIARKAAGAYVDMRNMYLENEQLRALVTQCTKGATP